MLRLVSQGFATVASKGRLLCYVNDDVDFMLAAAKENIDFFARILLSWYFN
jgi:hypothetical protein